MLLTLIILLPVLVGVLGLLFAPASKMKHWALAALVADLVLVLYAAATFDWSAPITEKEIFGEVVANAFQHHFHLPWPTLEAFQISYTVGVDTMAMLMVMLTAGLGILGVLCSWTAIAKREKEFYFHLLLLQTGIIATFCALDMVLFYICWELMVLPLFFLIGVWGSANRFYATLKFVIYTVMGSLMMLLAIMWMYYNGPVVDGVKQATYSYELMLSWVQDDSLALWRTAFFPMLGLLLAFLIKVPLWPLHTWLPDAHTEAPTAGSVILAGVLLKTGIYGILRFCVPLFPDATVLIAPAMTWLAIIAIIYGAMTAMVQKDVKRLVAYSSVSHMGFIVLGVYSFNGPGMDGAILQMINHGISTGGLFLAVGMIYERRHTRLMADFGGLAHRLPIFAALTMVMVLSSVGLPGLNGFVGEFPILIGAMANTPILHAAAQEGSIYATLGMVNYTWVVAALAATGVVLGAVYLLIMYQKVFFGELDKEENKVLSDLNLREISQLGVLCVAAVVIGLFPNLLLKPIAKSTEPLLAAVARPLDLQDNTQPAQELAFRLDDWESAETR